MNGYPTNASGRKDDRRGGFRDAMIGPFLPGQKSGTARQLSQGFGGSVKHWNKDIGQLYAPFQNAVNFPYAELGPQPKGGGKGGGKGDGKGDGKGGDKGGVGDEDKNPGDLNPGDANIALRAAGFGAMRAPIVPQYDLGGWWKGMR